jgi:hypothetical protein
MKRQLRVAVLSGLFLLSSQAIVGSARAQTAPPMTPMPVMDQMTNISYFTLRDGMSSTLTLQNLAPTPTKVTVTLFNTEGRAHALDPITLDPHSFKEVQLADVAPQGFDSGNVEVAFNGISMVVTCQVSVFSLKERVSFESREADMMDFESANLAGILSLPRGADGFLAVTNVAKNRITFELTAGSLKKTAALFPRETQLIKLNEDELATPALVKLQHNGMPGDLITTGYVLNLKNGYSSGFFMVDPGILRSSVLAGAHFLAGQPDPSEGFPEGTRFSSPLLLANVSAKPVVAHVSVDYTVKDKQDSKGSDDDAKKNNATVPKDTVLKVKDLTIAPGGVQQVELSDALGGVGQIAEAGVDIAYDAAPGSIIGQLTSVDQSGDYTFAVPVKDPEGMSEKLESVYPWTLENGMATVLHLKNTTKEAQTVGVLIRYDGGTYIPDGFDLQPYQTIAVDIKKLRDSKQPDGQGHLIPSNATHGQLAWVQQTPYTVIGRAEGTDVAAGIARSFSCSADCCNEFSSLFELEPDPMNGPVGDGGQFTATNIGNDCYGNGFAWYNVQGQATSWTTSNAGVATVSSTGYGYCAGRGSATVNAYFPVRTYYLTPPTYRSCGSNFVSTPSPSPVNVNPPDHLVVVGDSTGVLNACPTRVFFRQLALNTVDVNGNPVIGASVQESFLTTPVNSCAGGLAPRASSCQDAFPTLAEFVDNISVNTCNVPPAPFSCGYNLTDEWQWCGSATAFKPVNIGKLTDITHNNQITVNGNASPLTPGGTNLQSLPIGTVIRP